MGEREHEHELKESAALSAKNAPTTRLSTLTSILLHPLIKDDIQPRIWRITQSRSGETGEKATRA